MKINRIKYFMFFLFLLSGMSSGLILNGNNAVASTPCSKTYCQSGECAGNDNMTACASPTGTLPCTGHINCMPNPQESD
jgi:hypothetical protein